MILFLAAWRVNVSVVDSDPQAREAANGTPMPAAMDVSPLPTEADWIGSGTAIAPAGDIDRDGFGDIFVGVPGQVYTVFGSTLGLDRRQNFSVSGDRDSGFGTAIASAGDVNGDGHADLIVGAPLFSEMHFEGGSASIYHGHKSGLLSLPVWEAAGEFAETHFGHSVSTAGDINADGFDDVIVGAPFSVEEDSIGGRAFLFLGSKDGVTSPPAWTMEFAQDDAGFGTSVGPAGDINNDGYADVVISAPSYDGDMVDEGAVFVFVGSASGLSDEPDWILTGGQAGAQIGNWVTTAGDVNADGISDLLIAASRYDDASGRPDDGRVYVYLGSSDGLGTSSYWENTTPSGYLAGYTAAGAGDVNGDGLGDIIVGSAIGFGDVIARLFLATPTGVMDSPVWLGRYGRIELGLLGRVATAGDVNGDGYNDVMINAGSTVFAYYSRPSTFPASLQTSSQKFLEEPGGGASFGNSISSAGDVNGDGYIDAIVGSYLWKENESETGAAFVYMGSEGGLSARSSWSHIGDSEGGWFGYSVAGVGDVTGDGYDDVVVGAPRAGDQQPAEGAAFLFAGSPNGLANVPIWKGESNQSGAQYGFSVSGAGDVNGDGYADVVIGAFRYANSAQDEGRTYLYYGSPHGFSDDRRWTVDGGNEGAWFGYSVAGLGDVNGDEYGDLIVGAPFDDNGEIDEGRAYIFTGSATGPSQTPYRVLEVDHAGARFGIDVSCAGDVDGNGMRDILVGSLGNDLNLPGTGSVFVFLSHLSGIDSRPDWSAGSDLLNGAFGSVVTCAGDINGDGFSDILVGDYLHGGQIADAGRLVAFKGSADGLSTTPDWEITGSAANEWLGAAVAAAGDLNGDGLGDALVATSNRSTNSGKVWVYETERAAKPGVRPRQFSTDGLNPIGIYGFSGDRAGFRIRTDTKRPVGAGKMFLEWEAKPFWLPFNGVGTHRGTTYVLTAEQRVADFYMEIEELIEPPYTGELVHWRVRIATDSPFFRHSKWMSHANNVWGGGTLRLGEAPVIQPPPEPPHSPTPTFEFDLRRNYPNPFNPATTIEYTLSSEAHVELTVYDVQGRRVITLENGLRPTGLRRVTWDGNDRNGRAVSSGLYFYRLVADGAESTRKMMMLK